MTDKTPAQEVDVAEGLTAQTIAANELVERLRKRANQEREIAANGAVVAGLLAPEMAKFDAREAPWNTYAVRMAVDHKNSAKRDNAFADDLYAAAATITRLTDELAGVKEALRPFAREADAQERVTSFSSGDCIIPRTKITIGDLRRARALLGGRE